MTSPLPMGTTRKTAKSYTQRIERILALRDALKDVSDDEILKRANTARQELSSGASKMTRAELQVEVFALASEVCRRKLGQTPYPVQILGGLVIADGAIAEMATGEGKTLTAVAPVAWWALHGKGTHVATANDYLASRDAKDLAPAYNALGLTVAFTDRSEDLQYRKDAYLSDITYATAQTLGFDYLTDNLAHDPNDVVRRDPFAAIIDEADSLLIDEARTPLIISAPNARLKGGWDRPAEFAKTLVEKEDFEADKAEEFVILTEQGADKAEAFFNVLRLYDHPLLVQRILTSLRAEHLLTKDKDYLVNGDDIVLVDSNTGRVMANRRFQDGLHEALEAKEGVTPKAPNVVMASTTIQSFFGMYPHLGGMTGTAMTDAEELTSTYGTPVLGIPTHRPRLRVDHPDVLFSNSSNKFQNLAAEISKRQKTGQPVLVGTSSIEESERLSQELKKLSIEHEVLNARAHERESAIIAQAGRRGAVTVSTNMAGRGVDIKLGGDPGPYATSEQNAETAAEKAELLEKGGLAVLATSRASSRRVDNQLRGRAGRQGEPGETQFFLAADDELLTTFGGPQVSGLIAALSSSQGALSHPALSKAITRSQKKVEGIHADSRRSLVEFDGVYTAQRGAFYKFRNEILNGTFTSIIEAITFRGYKMALKEIAQTNKLEKLSRLEIEKMLGGKYPNPLPEGALKGSIEQRSKALASEAIEGFRARFSPLDQTEDSEEVKAAVLRKILLDMIDQFWTQHLTDMQDLQGSVSLRRYAQVDPKIAFAQEAKAFYESFMQRFYRVALSTLWGLNLSLKSKPEDAEIKEEAALETPAPETDQDPIEN